MQLTPAPAAAGSRHEQLRAAAKPRDSTYATFVVTPLSLRLVPSAARLGLSPSAVTALSVAVALLASAAFAIGSRPSAVAGAVALQLAFVLDCADGQLARYTGRTSAFGGWFDGMADRAKEYAVFAGLAAGSVRGSGDDVWLLACLALTLQTFRHLVDLSFSLRAPASDGSGMVIVPRARTPLSSGLGRIPGARWVKSSMTLPIGERYALISVTAALWRPRLTFVVLIAWGLAAAGYVLAQKVAGSLTAPRPSVPGIIRVLRDDGPVAALVRSRASTRRASHGPRSPRSRLVWLGPPVLRLVEYGGLLAVAVLAVPAATPACYALLAACAYHHYDIAYRVRHAGVAPPRLVGLVGGGWDGRLLLAAALGVAGAVQAGFGSMAVGLAALFGAESVRFWTARRTAAVWAGGAAPIRAETTDDRTDPGGWGGAPAPPADRRPAEGAAAGLR